MNGLWYRQDDCGTRIQKVARLLLLRTNRVVRTVVCLFLLSTTVEAAELLMMEQRGCPWCRAWHKEIGGAYDKTSEGQAAPLRRIDIHRDIPDDLTDIPMDRFTPTFVLVHEGAEIGRIRGYADNETFWFLFSELIKKLPSEARAGRQ